MSNDKTYTELRSKISKLLATSEQMEKDLQEMPKKLIGVELEPELIKEDIPIKSEMPEIIPEPVVEEPSTIEIILNPDQKYLYGSKIGQKKGVNKIKYLINCSPEELKNAIDTDYLDIIIALQSYLTHILIEIKMQGLNLKEEGYNTKDLLYIINNFYENYPVIDLEYLLSYLQYLKIQENQPI